MKIEIEIEIEIEFEFELGKMGVQQKLIFFFFHASLVFIIFPLVGATPENHQITNNPSRTKDNSHIKVRYFIYIAYSELLSMKVSSRICSFCPLMSFVSGANFFFFLGLVKMSPRLQFEITLHGFLLWASMGFLMPVGILAIRLSNKEENPRRHRIVFYVHSILQASISKFTLHNNSKSDVIIDCLYCNFFYFNLKESQ